MYFKRSRFRNILISPFFLKTEDEDFMLKMSSIPEERKPFNRESRPR